MTAVLEATGLVAGYLADVDILDGADLAVADGELVTVVGPNGAGKSTLLKVIIGLLHPRRGEIRLWGEDVSRLEPHRVARLGVGYVPQRANVFTSMTVDENLELGLAGRRGAGLAARRRAMFDLFPALATKRRQRAGTMSGGERQTLAMARVLMASPRLLLLDEPSAGLAPAVVDAVFAKIAEVNAQGVAILLVEQNARRALAMSDRGYVLELGANRFQGRGPELLADPKVAELYLGGVPREAAR
jgi:ABC-type branched-subunit amino acid transport system ATPase component